MSILDNEKELYAAIRAGDERAFEAFYEAYKNKIYKMMYFSTSNELDAEELTRDVFLGFVESIPRFKGHCKTSTWLYSIAKNILKSYYNKKKKYPTSSLDDSAGDDMLDFIHSLPDDEATPDELVERKEVHDIVRAVFDRLPESYRSVITHRYINGLSSRETAEIMDKTEGNVRVLLHRASNAFIRELSRLEEETGEALLDKPESVPVAE
ncbi:MAG: sigma-70 family RNA polymerase sigma factor [bacterium]|nr:sigma-70 family RNA polymerase sigma factor [bacterium]